MISIIICSADAAKLEKVKKNIAASIGLTYEIIAIDNSSGQFSICEAYNAGADKARHFFLCFMHEDISFDTENWGLLVCSHLANPAIGLIGVAGGDSKSLVPSSWSIPVFSTEVNIVQHFKSEPGKTEKQLITRSNSYGNANQVAVLDGVWLCTRKDVFRQFRFDEKSLHGFHGYDIDYSLQVGQQYKLLVIFDILIHHYSEGNPNREWMNSAITLSRKWKKQLPKSLYAVNKKLLAHHHWKTMQVFLQHLFRLKYQPIHIFGLFLEFSFNRFFRLRNFLSLFKYYIQQLTAKV